MQIVKNYLYNVGYQLLTVIAPLLTMTYLAHVLGTQGVGIQAWTNSVVTYFLLLATLGITLYGQREIAYVRDDVAERDKRFWEIQILHIIVGVIALIIYFVFIFGMSQVMTNEFHKYYPQLILQGWVIVSGILDISWYFMGLEDFKKTVVRNSLVKIAMVILIFVLVKSSHDVNNYILLLALTQVIGNITMWFYLPGKVKLPKWSDMQIMRHLGPTVAMFIPTIATQIYLQLNKTMLPMLAHGSADLSGFYDNADKIVKVSLALVTAMGTVMLPRVANQFANGDHKGVNKAIYSSMDFVTALAVPLMFGMAAVSQKLILWFLGQPFAPTGVTIAFLSPIILFIAWSNVIGTQYLMPVNRVRDYTVSVTLGAVVNIVLNFGFIPLWGLYGAAYATALSELIVTVYQIWVVRKDLDMHQLFGGVWKYFIAGAAMFIVVWPIQLAMPATALWSMIEIAIGGIIYAVLIVVLKTNFAGIIIDFVKGKLHRA